MGRTPNRRRFLRAAAAGVSGSMVALAGCSDPGDDGNDNESDDGGVYRFEEAGPQAGISAGGSSPG